MAPQSVHVLILRNCEYIILHGKRDFTDVIKLRIFRWEDYPGLSGWYHCNHTDPLKREARGSETEREDIRTEAEVRQETRCFSAGFDDGRRGHEPLEAGKGSVNMEAEIGVMQPQAREY